MKFKVGDRVKVNLIKLRKDFPECDSFPSYDWEYGKIIGLLGSGNDIEYEISFSDGLGYFSDDDEYLEGTNDIVEVIKSEYKINYRKQIYYESQRSSAANSFKQRCYAIEDILNLLGYGMDTVYSLQDEAKGE